MKILLSPIGNTDPHGKNHLTTGLTLGSVLSICACAQPDHVILLPTRSLQGEGTCQNAIDTKEELEAAHTGIQVQIDPPGYECRQ